MRLKLKLGFFFILSIAFIFGGYVMNKNAESSNNWQSTTGTVIASTVVEEKRPSRNGNQVEYNPLISYEYKSPHGVLLHSEKTTYGGSARKKYQFQAEKVVANYKVGTLVTVYFNPNNPNQSCLVPGRTGDGIALMVIGALIFLAELIFFGFYRLDRYAGLGEFDNRAAEEKAEKISAIPLQSAGKQPDSSLIHEYIVSAKHSPFIKKQLETHLFFGPIYRGTHFGTIVFGFFRSFLGKKSSLFQDEEQIVFIFLLTKTVLGGLSTLFVLMAPFLFLMKAPDASADLLLGLIWLPGLEFIPKLTPHQKYITLCRLLLTIPAVYMGINSGNWSW